MTTTGFFDRCGNCVQALLQLPSDFSSSVTQLLRACFRTPIVSPLQGAWGILFTPLAHGWYNLLDKMVPGKVTASLVLKKTALDQLTWTPVINVIFLSSVTLMSTGSFGAAVQAVQEKLWPVLKVNWVVWPLLSAINLGLVPPPYRLLWINFCSLGWSAYLSMAANAKASTSDLHVASAPTDAAASVSSPAGPTKLQ